MAELRRPRDTTIRKLFAQCSNRCAFDTCTRVIVDPATGTIVGEVCHICAQNEGGPRFDPGQTSEQRHSLENLVLLCREHHKIIDADENVGAYTVDHLLEVKRRHEAGASSAQAPALTAEAIVALLATVITHPTSTTHMDFRGAFFNAGGFGGEPGGAGGGGGVIHVVGITPAGFQEEVSLAGKPGAPLGGGGGGGGATVFSGRLASLEDLERGFAVNSFFFANSAEVREGLLFALGAGWDHVDLRNVPHDVSISVAAVIETGTVLPNTLLALAIVVEDPSGRVIASESFELAVSPVIRPVNRQPVTKVIRFRVTEGGVWAFTLRSGDAELSRMRVEFNTIVD